MPLNETGAVYFRDVFVPSIGSRIQEIVTAPFHVPDMIWVLAPLFFTMIMIEFYIGRYRDEELGWNTALGNSMILVFVGLDLLRRIYGAGIFEHLRLGFLPIPSAYAVIALLIFSLGLLNVLVNFFHLLPKSFAFKVSSPLVANLTACLAIILTYASIPADVVSLLAVFVIFVVSVLAIDLVHLVEPRHMERRTNVGAVIEAVLRKD